MRLNELLNKRKDAALWSMAPCEICDTPTRWCLYPYCRKCEWLVAFWRDGGTNHEMTLGDMPGIYVLNGDTALTTPEIKDWLETRGAYVDPLESGKVIGSTEYWRFRLCGPRARQRPEVFKEDRTKWWNEQNQLETMPWIEREMAERD